MSFLKFDYRKAEPFLKEYEVTAQQEMVTAAHNKLHGKTGLGSDYLGWVDLPVSYDKAEYERIKKAVAKIRGDSDVLIVIGIGGSYLGARAAIEMLSSSFSNLDNMKNNTNPMVFFAGCNLSATYLADLMDLVDGYDVSLNVISKSGTTTEPAVAFRLLKEKMEHKYGKQKAAERIYATTDKARGALRTLADREGYETFVIPDDVGGRFSVLTPVGLLPIGVAGADLDAIMRGAKDAFERYKDPCLERNDCYAYAAARNALSKKGKVIEIMVNYEPGLHFITEWWKQLYGESEGKDGKGIFPTGVDFTTDLHSMGQYIQDGMRDLFETTILVEHPRRQIVIETDEDNMDGLNFLAGMDLNEVNKKASQGTLLAHTDGGVPNLSLTIPAMDAYSFGALVYFFEKACGISGHLLGVNPFNQPGVEAYKKNMFALLGKPGYEDLKADLEERL